MFCGECGKESVDEFKFCPNCGKPVRTPQIAIETPSSAHEPKPHEPQLFADHSTNQSASTKDGFGRARIRAGTVVFGAFSALSLLVSILKGIVPIYLLEAALWAGTAWYWQRKKTHSEIAKSIVIVLAVLVAVGETIHIAIQATPQSSKTPVTAGTDSIDAQLSRIWGSPTVSHSQAATPAEQKFPDLSGLFGPGAKNNGSKSSQSSECPSSLPSGVDSKTLKVEDLSNMIGTNGDLTSEQSYDSYYAPNGRAWNANLTYTNKTNYCVSWVGVELQLNHAGTVSNERHSIVFQPLLGPGQSQSVDVKLRIITNDRGEDVALLGWHTIKASGFPSGSDAPTYDENGFQIVKDPKPPSSTRSDTK